MLEMLDLGYDITKLRTRIQKNLPYLSHEDSLRAFVKIQKDKYAEAGYSLNQLQSFFLSVSTFLSSSIVFTSYKNLARHPYSINRFALFHLEKPFGWKCQQPLSKERMNYLDYLVDQRLEELRNNPNLMFFKSINVMHREEDPNDPEFPFYFALTLRQTSVLKIPDFLKAKSRLFDRGYLEFLSLLLLDFDDLFVSKTKDVVKKWIQDQKDELDYLKKTAFLPVPKGWKRIDGRLSPDEIKAAFSFLHEIAEFTQDKIGYLTEKEVFVLLECGIAFPNEDRKTRQFTLNLNRERSKRLFFYAIYRIRVLHAHDTWDAESKLEWAQFLKKRFTNFSEMSIIAIKNEVRNRMPKSAPEGVELILPFEGVNNPVGS